MPRTPQSKKTPIIEALFNLRWQGPGNPLADPLVTLVQVEEAIGEYNSDNPQRPLSRLNPANFLKDFIRNKASANRNWPQSVLDRGYTARQATGEGLCFEFVPLQAGQALPFPITGIHAPGPNVVTLALQSTSMPLASRRLGRKDEAWLIQVIARLHVIESHLALRSPRTFLQVDLLQTTVKLAKAEIDALFLGIEQLPDIQPAQFREVVITCEAKGLRDDILEDQLIAQVKAAFRMSAVNQNAVMPIAIKAIAPSRVYVVQFRPVNRPEAADLSSLSVESEAIYDLIPPVPGVGK